MSRSHWLDWKPQDKKFEDSRHGEATETSKTPPVRPKEVFDVFEGRPQSVSPNSQARVETGEVPGDELTKGSHLEVPAAPRMASGTFGPPAEEPDKAEPKVEVSLEMLAEFQPAIDEFTPAGFRINAIRDGKTERHGIPEEKWRQQRVRRLCDAVRKYRPVLSGVVRRHQGESVLFAGPGTTTFLEWVYNPAGITPSTWDQISELAEKGEGHFLVIAWPDARLLYDSRRDSGGNDGSLPEL